VNGSVTFESMPPSTDARPIVRGAPPSGNIVGNSLFGGFTFGFLPALVWPAQLRDVIASQRRRLYSLCQSLDRCGVAPELMRPLWGAYTRLEGPPLLWILPVVFSLAVGAIFITNLVNWFDPVGRLIALTYGFRPGTFESFGWSISDIPWWPPNVLLHRTWCVGLSVAYLIHWMQVGSCRAGLRRFEKQFHPIALRLGLPPLQLPRLRFHIGFLFLLASFIFFSKGAWWGMPMLLAGAAQNRYTWVIRRALPGQIAACMAALPAPRPTAVAGRRCVNSGCLAVLPAGAAFCPRCGTRVVSPTVDISA
jgi:hypothetical protein